MYSGICLVRIDCQKVSGYLQVITSLPEAETEIEGARAWTLQSDLRQLVFCEFEANLKVPEHHHNYPQWGLVVDGSLELKIDDTLRFCKKGDEYLISQQTQFILLHSLRRQESWISSLRKTDTPLN